MHSLAHRIGQAKPEISRPFPRTTCRREHQLATIEASMPSPLLMATSIGAALVLGLVPVFFSSIQPCLAERLALPPPRLVTLNRWLYLAWVPLMPLAGWLVDHGGIQE